MTLEERISRIEVALAGAGLMDLQPTPTKEEILRDLQAGDASSLRILLRKNKGQPTGEWPFVKKSAPRRKASQQGKGKS